MKIFLDSVNLEEIKQYQSYGIIDGVTTNPSLMAKSSSNFQETVSEICNLVQGDVSIEAPSSDYKNMLIEGNKILQIAPNIVLKLPVTWDGIKACKYFTGNGDKVNMTLCFSSNQALLAAKAGATYISPFIGRLEDVGEDGLQLITDICNIYDNYGFNTKILAASVRTIAHISAVAIRGADVVTVPGKLLSALVTHDLTNKGLTKFTSDWTKSGMKI